MSGYKIDKIIETNSKRVVISKYDPIKGIESPIERQKLYFSRGKYINIPLSMRRFKMIDEIINIGSVCSYARRHKIDSHEIESAIIKLRIECDFEYWCAVCVKIQDKQSKAMVPLILRSPQRKLVKLLIGKLENNEPIRVVMLKARQWGGSTVVQMFMAWIQLFHRKGWHSVIIGDIEEQSRNIRAMYSRLAVNHPSEVFKIEFESFEGSAKNKVLKGRDAIVYLGSMQKPDSIRSADVMMAHLSEVGLWRSTEGKKPEDIVQSIAGTVPLEPYSLIIMESTAKGIGNFFHRWWSKASSNENGYEPLFVAWWEIDIYRKEFLSECEKREFAKSLTPQEISTFELGATLEGINWYRSKKHLDSYDDWRMSCEFPSTPNEAFQSTGRRAHAPEYISKMRKFCKEPKFRGELIANATIGKEAIDDSLHLYEAPSGEFLLWELPDYEKSISNRYIVSMDIGGRTKDADWSVISVIDRFWMIEGGVEECIATYRFHIDQDIAVWRAVQVAKYFCNALLVVEANSLNSKGSEGDHTLTILDEIKGLYSNLYCRTDPQKIREGFAERYGFYTTSSSKTDLVNQMNKRFRDMLYIERDVRALDEADYYEIKEDGSYGAVTGEHDDLYMSRAIALKASQVVEPPKEIAEHHLS